MFAQESAARVAASSTAAPPVSVRRNSRSGVWALLAHAVVPEKADGTGNRATGMPAYPCRVR